MIDLSKRQFKIYVQQLLDWLDGKFTAVASSIDFTTVNAKIDTVDGKVDTVSNKIDNIDIDTSDLAKQGDDPTATNTAIKQLIINEGIERANEYAEEIHDIIGDWRNE